MPLTAISTGMVDWVLPVAEMPAKLLEFVQNETRLQLPPEILKSDEPDAKVEDALDRETVSEETRGRKMNPPYRKCWFICAGNRPRFRALQARHGAAPGGAPAAGELDDRIPEYLKFLRKHPAEARALLQDLLIGVTHFFRDQESFAALEANIPQLFAGKGTDDQVRVWVVGCATGEEAYSIAILLCEQVDRLDAPPPIQVFATDIDEQAVQEARDGLYPSTIEADVSQKRLRHFFQGSRALPDKERAARKGALRFT